MEQSRIQRMLYCELNKRQMAQYLEKETHPTMSFREEMMRATTRCTES